MARQRPDDFAAGAVAIINDPNASPTMPTTLSSQVNEVLAALHTPHVEAVQFIAVDDSTRLLLSRVEALRVSLPVHIPVLITGPSGVGKEYIAHQFKREGYPFISLNCAAFPEHLIASLLFGHKKGSFTGAIVDTEGAFLAARAGVIFLDEIGDMPLSLQPILLRVLQEREVVPVGAQLALPIHCRIVAATNKDLGSMVASDNFREDLLARLDMISLHINGLETRPLDCLAIAAQLGLTEQDMAAIRLSEMHAAKLYSQNVRALQAYAARKRYLGDMFA